MTRGEIHVGRVMCSCGAMLLQCRCIGPHSGPEVRQRACLKCKGESATKTVAIDPRHVATLARSGGKLTDFDLSEKDPEIVIERGVERQVKGELVNEPAEDAIDRVLDMIAREKGVPVDMLKGHPPKGAKVTAESEKALTELHDRIWRHRTPSTGLPVALPGAGPPCRACSTTTVRQTNGGGYCERCGIYTQGSGKL